MKNLPVINREDIEREELLSRIDLANRPSIDIELDQIDEIAADLAEDSDKRKLFVDDPAAYLTARSLPVPECRLVAADMSLTSEVCTVNVICNANFFANVNAVTKVNAGLAVNAITAFNVANAINTYNYGAVLYSDESILLAKSLGSLNNQVL